MCGIVGYVSTSDKVLDVEKENFLNDALIIDTFRGMDSTGVLTLCDDFTLNTHKELGEGWDFVKTPEYNALPNGWAAIGHNRAATKGKVSKENAHPFKAGPITLVHNGTLRNMGRNLPNYSNKFDVDSIQIARALSHNEPEAAHEVLSMIDGAYALVWSDSRDESINITRNHSRPLHFGHNAANTVLWFMSEGTHLSMIKKRKWCLHADMGNIFQFGAHTHMKWKKGSITPEVTKYSPFVVTNYHTTHPYGTEHNHLLGGYVPPVGRSTRKTKPKAPLSHLISLNGSVEAVPEALLSELSDTFDLSPEDTLVFTPERFIAYPKRGGDNPMGFCEGKVFLPEWDYDVGCVVHNMSVKHADKVTLKNWHVTPYAVSTQMSEEWGIMAKLKRFNIPMSRIPEIPEEDDVPETLLGPFGRLYSGEDWRGFTSNGCSNCSKDLDPTEHREIWWVGEMERSPLCCSCADYLTGGTIH